MLLHDRAPKTVATYMRAYRAWKCWAIHHGSSYLPDDPVIVALFLVSIIQQLRSVSSVNSALYGISWVHKTYGYEQPIGHPLVKQDVEVKRRILARPTIRKKPLTLEKTKRILDRLMKGSLAQEQVAAMFALGFFGFLRWDDISRLLVDDLHFADTHVAIFLE